MRGYLAKKLRQLRPGGRLIIRDVVGPEDGDTAAEFLSKKDYTDNWQSEMNEEFCFWSFSRWKSVLAETGFRIRENPNRPESGSRVYTNAWIVEHRHSGSVQLVSQNDEALPWPPSNMVLVAEAPWDS